MTTPNSPVPAGKDAATLSRTVSVLVWIWVGAAFVGHVWALRSYARPVLDLLSALIRGLIP